MQGAIPALFRTLESPSDTARSGLPLAASPPLGGRVVCGQRGLAVCVSLCVAASGAVFCATHAASRARDAARAGTTPAAP